MTTKRKTKSGKRPECHLASQVCSGELMRRYSGKKPGDPEFNACRICLVFMKLTRRVKEIGPATLEGVKS